VSDEAERDTLARFCAELGRLRALARGPAGAANRTLVEQAVRAARRGEPIGELVAALEAGPAPERPEEPGGFVTRGGLPPRLSAVALPPVTGGYRCPADACNRVEVRRAGTSIPSCDVHQQALRFVTDGEGTW
jgi:hypothetical protein